MAQIDQSHPLSNRATENVAQAGSGPEPLVLSGRFDPTQRYQTIRLPDGSLIQVESELLSRPSAMVSGAALGSATMRSKGSEDLHDGAVVPVVEETLEVGKRTVTTGTVRLHKTVQEYDQALDELLAVRTYDVERVVRNETVESAPPVRYEGETTIYPLVEERLILTKQLVLREEIRVTKRDTERRDTQVVTLRREHIEVERVGADGKS